MFWNKNCFQTTWSRWSFRVSRHIHCCHTFQGAQPPNIWQALWNLWHQYAWQDTLLCNIWMLFHITPSRTREKPTLCVCMPARRQRSASTRRSPKINSPPSRDPSISMIPTYLWLSWRYPNIFQVPDALYCDSDYWDGGQVRSVLSEFQKYAT